MANTILNFHFDYLITSLRHKEANVSKWILETPVCDNTEGGDGHNYFDSDHNMIMIIFFKFRRWHDNVGMMLMMITTIVEWGLFSQLQQWLAEALNAENVTLGKIACFELAISFCSSTHKCSFYEQQLKKKLCHTSCFLTAICYGLGLSLQKNGWLSWGGVQTDIPKTSHPCVFAFIFVLYLSFYLHLFLCLCLSSFFLTGGCWSNGAIERMVELRWCSNKQTTSIPFSNNFSGNSALVGISLKTKKIQKRFLSMH